MTWTYVHILFMWLPVFVRRPIFLCLIVGTFVGFVVPPSQGLAEGTSCPTLFQSADLATESWRRTTIAEDAYDHILKGNFSRESGDVIDPKWVISGGVHTARAMNAFLSTRRDLIKFLNANKNMIETQPNGVISIYLPACAFANPQVRRMFVNGRKEYVGKKTLFPRTWTDEKIKTAITTAFKIGVLKPEPAYHNGYYVDAVVDQVRIKVVLEELVKAEEVAGALGHDGSKTYKVITAHPNGQQ